MSIPTSIVVVTDSMSISRACRATWPPVVDEDALELPQPVGEVVGLPGQFLAVQPEARDSFVLDAADDAPTQEVRVPEVFDLDRVAATASGRSNACTCPPRDA